MKKNAIRRHLAFLILLFSSVFFLERDTLAQSLNQYTFVRTSSTYQALTGGTQIFGPSVDDGTSRVFPLGFTFQYAGTAYTSFRVNSNGFVTLGADSGGARFANDLAISPDRALCPLWDDLATNAFGEVRGFTSGTSPNSAVVVQYTNMRWDFNAPVANTNFQVWLYEGTNVIEFRYGTFGTPANPSASIGLTNGTGIFQSVTPVATPTVSSSVANNSIASAAFLTSGTVYRFTPPTVPLGIPTWSFPVNIATNVRTDTVFFGWSAVPNATRYQFQISQTSDFPATSLTTQPQTNNQTIINLSAGTTYFWRVRAETATQQGAYSSVFSFTTAAPTNITVQVNVPPFTVSFPDNPVSRNYQMFSIPGDPSDITLGGRLLTLLKVSDIIRSGRKGTDWRMYRDNGLDSNVQGSNFLSELGPDSTLVFAGEGFWLIQRGNLTIPEISATLTLNSDGTYGLPLFPGKWNIVGNPFSATVPWSSVVTANGLTNEQPFEFKDGSFVTATTLVAYKAYYFRGPGSLRNLRIPRPTGSEIEDNLVSKASSSEPSYDWRLKFGLKNADSDDKENYLGIAPSSLSGLDKLDTPKPPVVFDLPFVYFKHTSWDSKEPNFSADIRPSIGDGQVWDIETRTPNKISTTLYLKGVESIPPQYDVMLVNTTNSIPINLRSQPNYTFQPVREKTGFKVIVGQSTFVTEQLNALKPKAFELNQNYPNPFNPTTIISFQTSKESNVQLEIYNLLGQRIKTLVNSRLGAATYSILWDGTTSAGVPVSTGIYFYRLIADGNLIGTKKMLLTK
jgi:hypothetical protein